MVYAYTNFNLGDDLFIKVLCERYPNTNFILNAPRNYKQNLSKLENVIIYSNDTFISRGINFLTKIFKKEYSRRKAIAKKSDAIVHIGGSIFIEKKGWQKRIENRKAIQNKPFFLLGANFGPFSDNEYYKEYRSLFNEYTDVCFREQYSYDLFKDLSNVRMAADVIFQLKKKGNVEEDNNIVISVIKPSIREDLLNYDNIYYNKIKEITMYFINEGYNVTLMSFCEKEGDKEAVETIKKMIPDDYLHKVIGHYYKFNMEETLNIIERSKFVVGTRFHAMILGWVYDKPVFPIAYSKKMINVMEDINFTGSYTDLKNIHKLDADQVFNSMKTNRVDITEQIVSAEKQFEKLDEYLCE